MSMETLRNIYYALFNSICVQNKGTYIILGEPQSCPSGLICDDDAELECQDLIPKEYLMASNVNPADYDASQNDKIDEM
ncbi:hypothetical protein NQ318_020714 [Aromia moschata]|uniref:Uncharacterized protein n=1 Tax=Aromia moschata TaxID=1265417 RepID=A0AAV8YWJ1_9CUCU|nr:hypothetical protein NQ318_020714 [Aromia moschata]